MITPSQVLPRPATDSTVSTGLPEQGLSTRFDPSTAITQGVVGDRKFGARRMNWILGGFGDWIAWLREAVPTRLTDTPRTLFLDAAKWIDSDGTSKADVRGGSGILADFQTMLIQAFTARVYLNQLSGVLPADGILTEVSVQLRGDAAWGALPDVMPGFTIVRVNSDLTTTAVASIVADTSANVAAFKLNHKLTLTLGGGGLDLETGGGTGPCRLYLQLYGAVKASGYQPVYYYDLQCKVKSKPYT